MRMTAKNKRNRGKFDGYLFAIDGKKITKLTYWQTKLRVAIDKKVDFFLNFRVDPDTSEKLLRLMDGFSSKSPSNLLKKIVQESFKLYNNKDKKIQVLMELWDCQNPILLQSKILEEAYKELQSRLLEVERKMELENLKKKKKV